MNIPFATLQRQFLATVVVAAGLSLASAADVPVAWQIVDEGFPNQFGHVYYDAGVGRVRLLEPNSPGHAPRVWEVGAGDRWRRVIAGGESPEQPTLCIGYDTLRSSLIHVDAAGSVHELLPTGWVEATASAAPPVVERCAMAFDERRGVMVFIGVESDAVAAPNVTWEYDGFSWVEIVPVSPPPGGKNPQLTYDEGREVVLLYGEPFDAAKPIFQAYVWEYRGTTWTRVTPLGIASPGRRRNHAWVYDPGRGKALLWGGLQDTVGTLADLWEWNGTQWTRVQETSPPGARQQMRAAHDLIRGRTLFYGGNGVTSTERLTLWSLSSGSDTTWTECSRWHGPRGYSSYAMAILEDSDRLLVAVGADGHTTATVDSWTWNEGGWVLDEDAVQPSSWLGFALGFDPVEEVAIGIGGVPYPDQIPVPETHRYESAGSRWTSIALAGPRARRNAGIAFSPSRGRVVMFGGFVWDDLGLGFDNETWEFEGGAWRQVLLEGQLPTPRENGRLATDSGTGSVWMYGGNNEENLSDLWTFDGDSWSLVGDDAPPGQRATHGLAHDPQRDRLVVFGGVGILEQVTWEWGNAAWHARTTATMPESDRWSVKLAYDRSREVIFLFGGQNDSGPRYDLWAYGADPDEDGHVGAFDNCRAVANPEQSNLDLDARGDVCDCAISDETVWGAPMEVVGVRFAASGESLEWNSLGEDTGPSVVYDVVRGDVGELPLDPTTPALCVGESLLSLSVAAPESPEAGAAWWYVVRGRNSCGQGVYGAASDGNARVTGACD